MPEVDRFGRSPRLWITVLVFVLGQLSEVFFQVELSMYQQTVMTLDLFSWILAYNTGATLSFLIDSSGWQRWLSTLIAIVASAILVVWLKRLRKGETWLAIALTLVFGGVLGSLYDRMVFDHVVDFIPMHWQNRWYSLAFNLADSAITIGAAVSAPNMFRLKKSGEAVYG